MNLRLYQNNSENNKVTKSITQLYSLTGYLRDDCSIIDPVIEVENISAANLVKTNYAYISEFGRYYYINNIVCKGNLFELHMHVDVLQSFGTSILNCSAVVARQQSKYNLYLQDGVFKTYADNHYQIKQFSNGFNSHSFIFSVAG